MPRFNKWLADIDPDASVLRVGKKAIRARLAAVVHYLGAASEDVDREESIHQLRIWTRRSTAALRLFKPLTPRSEGKRIKKQLRKIRQAAGLERDCDVMLDSLRAAADVPRSIIRALKKQRREARREFTKIRERKLRHDKLQERCDDLVGDLAWPKRHSSREPPPFAPWCRAQLAPLGEQFFALADGPLSQDARLHELRIAGKRLRYALELSPAALPARIHRRLYEVLTQLQERLGTVCDHLSAVARLQAWRNEAKSHEDKRALGGQIRREQEQLATHRRQFLRWWSAARRRRMRQDWDAALAPS